MEIHVVIAGETVEAIAEKYGVSVQKIIQDNELFNADNLVPGQTIVITYPVISHTVQEGDTLESIASSYGIPLLQILRNNPFLVEREYLYPGESLVISYDNSMGRVITGGFAYPYINRNVLLKILPYLTYLTIFNYTVSREGEIISYYDDTELINTCKAYGVAPLMLLTTLTTRGVPDLNTVYDVLTNEELQEEYIKKVLEVVISKGYYGVNLSFNFLNNTNQYLYFNLYNKISQIALEKGVPLLLTINPNKAFADGRFEYESVDYSGFKPKNGNITFLTFNWGYNFGPPLPIGSIHDINALLENAVNYIAPNKISIGIPVLGYDWELPYVMGFSRATSLTINSVLEIAISNDAVIEFDELSQTPFIRYIEKPSQIPHIIWFVDARSIQAIMKLVTEYGLNGTGIWNIMNYYAPMWLVINAQYEIIKIL